MKPTDDPRRDISRKAKRILSGRYEHDGCKECRFVGEYGDVDVHVCGSRIMLRHSSEPADYEIFDTDIRGQMRTALKKLFPADDPSRPTHRMSEAYRRIITARRASSVC